MKAIVCDKYGPPDILRLEVVPTPVPKENEALVKVYTASLNAADLETLRGDYIVRMASPFKPKYRIPGTDFAGRIEAVGKNITRYKPGDEIWGDLSFPYGSGTFAEYVCVPEDALRIKPSTMTFEQAAAAPAAAIVALQKLRAKNRIRPADKVLINGAGGGVGTFAVQIARYFGAEVTAVDSPGKLDMLRSLDVDHVIDYTRKDFTRNGRRYDLILDVVVHHSAFDYKRALDPGGVCIMVGGSMTRIFFNILMAPLISRNRKMSLGTWKPNNKEDLEYLSGLFEAGKIRPVIDKLYSLNEVPDAFRYLETGNVRGKLVIKVFAT